MPCHATMPCQLIGHHITSHHGAGSRCVALRCAKFALRVKDYYFICFVSFFLLPVLPHSSFSVLLRYVFGFDFDFGFGFTSLHFMDINIISYIVVVILVHRGSLPSTLPLRSFSLLPFPHFGAYEKSRSGKSCGATRVQAYNPSASHWETPRMAMLTFPTVGLAALCVSSSIWVWRVPHPVSIMAT